MSRFWAPVKNSSNFCSEKKSLSHSEPQQFLIYPGVHQGALMSPGPHIFEPQWALNNFAGLFLRWRNGDLVSLASVNSGEPQWAFMSSQWTFCVPVIPFFNPHIFLLQKFLELHHPRKLDTEILVDLWSR